MSASLDKIADIADIMHAKAESAEQSINSLGTALEVFHYTHNSGAAANDDDIEAQEAAALQQIYHLTQRWYIID